MQYNGQGLEKEPDRDPLDFELANLIAYQNKHGGSPGKKQDKFKSSQLVEKEAMSHSKIHEQNMTMFSNLFQYWCKKSTSRYLRIQDFYRFMVIFGLAPN